MQVLTIKFINKTRSYPNLNIQVYPCLAHKKMYTNENFVLREPRVLVDCFPFNRAEFTLLPKLKITYGLKSRSVPVFLFFQQNLVSQSPSAVRYSLSPFGPVFDGSSSLGALCSLKPCKKNCQLAKLLVF